jgi:flagellar M-ring protein FliF
MPGPTAQFVQLWRRLSASQRAVVIGGLLATLVLIGGLVFYGSQPDYSVLFGDLKSADAQAIVEKLKTARVPYQLSSGGTTISVPTEQVSELRLQMASSGALSSSHVGFDIFDKTSFGATDFTQQVNYQRALEGELARTLEGMKEVESARVHITRSRESVFTEKVEPAKASVMLKLKGHDLSAERTEAIVSLVASAVEGLDADSISVMDNNGKLLTGPAGHKGLKGGSGFDSQMDARRKFENENVEQIVALLEPVTGAGHVRANVNADIDFSQMEQTEESFDPKTAVIRAQQTTQEFKNAPGGTGGVAGARANDPAATATGVQITGNPTGNGRTATSTTYEISKVTRRTIGGGGHVKRLSVSVLVDSNPQAEGVTTPDGLKKIQELVSAAVGIDATRGDLLAVHMIPFEQPAIETPHLSWLDRNRDLVKTGIRYGVLALVALLLLFMVIRPARRALRNASRSEDRALLEARAEPLALPPAEAEPQHTAGPRTVAELQAHTEMEAPEMQLPPMKQTPETKMKNQVIQFSIDEPEKVAMALRNWLQEQ